MPIVTDRQVRRLHALLKSGKPLLVAAMRVDMDRKTARKYRDQAKLPSELETWPRTWRTREDSFADVWEEVREQLEASPGLQAKTLFGWLQRRYPGRFEDGQLRSAATASPAVGSDIWSSQGSVLRADPSSRPVGDIGFHPYDQPGRDDRRSAIRSHGLSLRSDLLELGDSLDLLLGELREPERWVAASVMGAGRSAAAAPLRTG